MSKHLCWLDDASWLAIEPLLPRGRRGAHRVDDRRVLPGIMHMFKTGADGVIVPLGMARTRRSTTALTAGAGRGFGRISSTP